VQARVTRGDWCGAAALALLPLSPHPGLLLMLAAVLPAPENPQEKYPVASLLLAAVVLLEFRPFAGFWAARGIRYGLWVALFLVQAVPGWLAHRPRALAMAAVLAAAGAAFCARASLQPGWPPFLGARFALDAAPDDAPGILGARFRAQSPPDALVLIPPAGETWTFKLHARRAVVVDDKNTPFTDRGLREWRDRMERVLGGPLTPGADPVAAWRARPVPALVEVAAHYGARYVLTRDEWHPALPGRRLDQEQGWSLWELPAPP
jgi:hypothetical protein